jgi:hypothetical protein
MELKRYFQDRAGFYMDEKGDLCFYSDVEKLIVEKDKQIATLEKDLERAEEKLRYCGP